MLSNIECVRLYSSYLLDVIRTLGYSCYCDCDTLNLVLACGTLLHIVRMYKPYDHHLLAFFLKGCLSPSILIDETNHSIIYTVHNYIIIYSHPPRCFLKRFLIPFLLFKQHAQRVRS